MRLVPKKVKSRNAGMNPVARAVARAQVKQALLDQKIQLYLLDEGAPCTDTCLMICQMLSAIIEAAAIDKIDLDNADVRVMRGAISACEQMLSYDKFSRANIVALERGLDAAFELHARVSPEAFNSAWNAKPRLGG